MAPILTVSNLTKRFGEVTAVSDISFTLAKGRSAALLGPNGAGKTTTLSMLCGLLPPTSGQIALNREEARDRRERIGYLPQQPVFFNWMTGKEYMQFAGQLFGLHGKKLTERADELLERLGLKDAAKRRIGGYSGGMKQRLGIAQAMVHRPELLVLDEPVSALDPVGRRELIDLLREMKEETNLLFSTHVLHDAEELCDDVLILNRGSIALAGALDDLRRMHQKPQIEITSEKSLIDYAAGLTRYPFINSVKLSEDQCSLSLQVDNREEARAVLLTELAREAIPVVRFEASYASLEALFLEVVGA
ncbi:ABC transporter ATP-binding protein [Gorillibacterium timonense]|uniref:ABC transporter ATP-binding protein n=1 Tax=Gorillibacterium timonense TaxID=1689269 RepID=UPI00071C51EE|nr:ABC transporter ATP-binding protein [Gorillibacterium timonense]